MNQLEELRRIQGELKRPFPAPLHEIRELPGGAKKWVFLRWQTVRERLDEVIPDWTIDHSEIQYLNNDAICRCGITILGVRKEAIASVPITLLSSKGNDMARGSAADRLNLRKKSFNFVDDLAKDIEDVSAEIGISETALAVFSLRAYIANYKAEKEKAASISTHLT